MVVARLLSLALLAASAAWGCASSLPPGPVPPVEPAPPPAADDASEPALSPAADEPRPEPALLGLAPPAPAAPAWLPLASPEPRSRALPSGLFNPMPGGQLAGYRADTGLDIAGNHMPVYALAASVVEYAEAGHTRWVGRHDSRFTVRLRLDEPLRWKDGKFITHAYYGHLSSLVEEVPSGQKPARHVEAGQKLGVSGVANGSPHLHLGLILDGHVEQESWDFLLTEAEVREALGVGSNGKRLR